ncbi:helix-turn-helix domain-containing protein [Marixanthomonas sp. SCSIO 43207]|uniref:helix-turn-helix domain-containing protein n=1 Tax=Marixanthomonas sp. SCSIO 43207 TaxID=2779360 RepID=UPI001CA92A1D|nr:helix-turn-helix domain-containing protein [Marixanthomonas sp. SCSIO 43207]UAB80969.1 helix-turn-helix domain-containing protein [Marixanthomonas sp. SCSIO 43207]
MKIIITKQEDLEELVQTSVQKSLKQFYSTKREKEKLNQNLSVRETATFLNVSELTVRNYIKRGLIKADKIGNRVLINRKKLEATLKEVKSLKYKR